MAGQDDRTLSLAVQRNTWRLMPLLSLGYLFNYLDRTSAGFAALQMNKDLGLTAVQFGLGAGLAFLPYCLLEVPSSMAMYRYGARRWFARILVTWGLAAAATAFAVGPLSFYALRLLLGAFEAGFFPGVIWYLSIWYPEQHRTRALALFAIAAPLSQLIAGPLSTSLLQMDGLWGLHGWRWMFIVEGLPATAIGIWCWWALADTPAEAKWLSVEERGALTEALGAGVRHRPTENFGAVLRDGRAWLLAGVNFGFSAGAVGIGLWLPLILQTHKLSNLAIGWTSTVPYLFATAGTLIAARFIDRTGRSMTGLIAALSLGLGGFLLSYLWTGLWPAVFGITVALTGTISARAVSYSLPAKFLSGPAAPSGIAFINSLSALGGFVGPYIVGWLKQSTGGYDAGMLVMAALQAMSIGLAILFGLSMRRRAPPQEAHP